MFSICSVTLFTVYYVYNMTTSVLFSSTQSVISVFLYICISVFAGAHTVQWTYSCDLKDDNTTGGNLHYVFDGKDFMSLNLTSATWITSNFIKTKWDGNGKTAKYWKDFLERECINWLKKVMKRSREILERNGKLYDLFYCT